MSFRQKKTKQKKTARLFTLAVMPTLAVNHLVVKQEEVKHLEPFKQR